MLAHRQSILLRAKRSTSLHNCENIDKEHELNQMKLHAKQERRELQEDYRRKCFAASAQEKRQIQEQRRKEMSESLKLKQEAQQSEKQFDSIVSQHFEARQNFCAQTEAQQEAEKRAYLRSIMEENKQAVEAKRRAEAQRRELERRQEREDVGFFDRTRRSFR
eukprot:TRINITY_DN5527_c0_g1_i1.p1 TRINITY_DN5527_c0_g1~~TRINITY_DN5527_c0_g1_i1.p1  ORF type:complete len:163 (+),score=49.63 TRINITY_DN5527_c0_g1_i1:29-517(+)